MARRKQSAPTDCQTGTCNRVIKPTVSKHTRRSNRIAQRDERSAVAGINQLPSPTSEVFKRTLKRERPKDLHSQLPVEPVLKRSRPLSITQRPPYSRSGKSNSEFGTNICWGEYFGQWPPMEVENSDHGRKGRLKNKRTTSQLRSASYSQSVRDGDSPPAWTRQHEEKMENAGLVMKEYQSQAAITSDCRRLCEDMKNRDCSVPPGPFFGKDRLLKLFDLVRFRNEARVVRDITPLIVPSPELLSIDDHPGMDQMSEAMDAEWTQCNTICGPRPKPDFAVGISPSAFADDEKEKLRLNHTSACPNLFPENMYFPFLVCEVKGSDRPIQEAERQSMHSASIAVQAIVQLYRKISAAAEIDRKILAFSVAHNNTTAKIFGHFAKIEEQKVTFFRCRLYTSDLAEAVESNNWSKPYSIVRAIYELFFPQHLARIINALARLQGQAFQPFTSQPGFDGDSQESADSQVSSQEIGTFKRPSLPSTNRMQQENDRLRDQLASILREQQLQREQQKDESREQRTLMERQMTQQKEQMEQQLAQQKEEAREQMTQQKEEARVQKNLLERQMTQQKEHMERQLAQQNDIIMLLKESRSK